DRAVPDYASLHPDYDRYDSSFASSEIFALSARDTGQFALASAAISSNFFLSMPGTLAVICRSTVVMVQLPDTCSSVSAAVVASVSGVKPALPSAADVAMVKQPACAAAISSSGLVPMPFSKRV